jgi:hypothetical protein
MTYNPVGAVSFLIYFSLLSLVVYKAFIAG